LASALSEHRIQFLPLEAKGFPQFVSLKKSEERKNFDFRIDFVI
jgi:hypothetical protein